MAIANRCFCRLLLGVLFNFGLLSAQAQQSPGPSSAQIFVGSNVRVSRDGSLAHYELIVAAHPKDSNILIGGSINSSRYQNGEDTCKAFASHDGGYSWFDADLPLIRMVEINGNRGWGCDPMVAFGETGTALFAGIAQVFDSLGIEKGPMLWVHRSSDGGRTWGIPAELGLPYDREFLAVDHVSRRFLGRVYVAAGHAGGISVLRSEDDGRSWKGPVAVAKGNGEQGMNGANIQVLSDGTLFVAYGSWYGDEKRRIKSPGEEVWFALSRDGGVTFGPSQKAVAPSGTVLTDLGYFARYAVDPRTQFRDRIYVVYENTYSSRRRLFFSMSSDLGTSWSEPRLLDPNAPVDAEQFHPEMAISKDGVLGVSWFDTRGLYRKGEYNEYFAASLDGGETFLPGVLVSTETSDQVLAINAGTRGWGSRNKMTIQQGWPEGGHYMGLTVDAAGVFHPFWTDTRNGSYQVYTARIRVESPHTAPVSTLESSVLTSTVRIIVGRGEYDATSKIWAVPVRVLNAGGRAVYGPLSVEVTSFSANKSKSPIGREGFVDAPNGRDGVGAVFDYTAALGPLGRLEPGEQSDTLIWKIRVPDESALNVVITTEIKGRVAR